MEQPPVSQVLDNSLSKIVVIELWCILVEELLLPHEIRPLVEVEGVVLVTVGSPRISQRGGRVVKRLGEVQAVVLVPRIIRGFLQGNRK